MIKHLSGNIFCTECDCIVNTVNCVGFMGKGIALEMSIRYPDLEKAYKFKCERNEIKIGELWLYSGQNNKDKKILNFPTKTDYKFPSKLDYLRQGLEYFRNHYKEYGIRSIAFPLLGASNGKIDSRESLNIMKEYLDDLDDILIEIYSFSRLNNTNDTLMESFKEYLSQNKNEKNDKILDYIVSEPRSLMFSDITEMKTSELRPDGTIKRSSVATKQYLQKIISSIKESKDNNQTALL